MSETDGSSAQMEARAVLEFLEEGFYDVPEKNGPRNINEYVVPPTDVLDKKGNDRMEDEADDEESVVVPDFTAYPNPFTDQITFNTKGRSGNIHVYDLRGVQLAILDCKPDRDVVFDGRAFSSGVYIAVFHDVSGEKHALRVIK